MDVQLRDRTYYLSDSAGICHYAQMYKCREHTHDFLEFVYILSGKCVHTVDGKVYPLKRGDMLIINYDQTHSLVGGTGEFVNIFLKPEYLNENLADQCNAFALLNLAEFSEFKNTLWEIKNVVSFSDFERETIENVVLNLEKEMTQTPAGFALSSRSWFNLLLVMIFRKMSQLLTERFSGISEELLVYIRTHCGEKLGAGEIAKRCHYHPSYFSRSFRAYTGMSFTEYVKEVRLERAAQLLANTDLPVQEVCYEVGYADRTKFFRDFRNVNGQTPLVYRKNFALER